MRLVKLDALLLEIAIEAERDPVTAARAADEHYKTQALTPPASAYAVLDRDVLVAAGGFLIHWKGRAEAWSLISRHARPRQLVKAVRMARIVIDECQRDGAFRRVEMLVRAECPWALSFAQALGFAAEGRLHAWDPLGRDMLLFARIKGG